MTDRELLELAAKAVGYRISHYASDAGAYVHDGLRDKRFDWNPRTSKSDTFALAVKLGLSVEPYPYYEPVKHSVVVKQRRSGDKLREVNPTEVIEPYGDDPEAATRLAVLRCAAEIGKSMS